MRRFTYLSSCIEDDDPTNRPLDVGDDVWCVIVDRETGIAYSLISSFHLDNGAWSYDEVEALVTQP